MSTPRKRFWTKTEITETKDGFGVQLDGREVKTPAKAPLLVPTRAIAEMIAAEWQAQGEKIDPETMPATRFANAAIDKVATQFDEVAAMLVAYGETDLLCYRATFPEALIARQAAAWDPLLDWASQRFGVTWNVTTGVMPTPQDQQVTQRLGAHVAQFTAFQLAAFHDLVAVSGSLVIGLAAAENHRDLETLWLASQLDEDWQIEQWGTDEDAAELIATRRAAFLNAGRYFNACTTDSSLLK
ncbi:ATP12 family chaperone protein [Pararhodobacter oceanensis]|uniref:ATP12 family chaperone protein n=1 Tax=Pararhodobacter oceanensis TaxID=2172121 RepID=UPI003A8EA90F